MQQYRAKINRKQTFFEIDRTVACPKFLVIALHHYYYRVVFLTKQSDSARQSLNRQVQTGMLYKP